MQPFLTLLQLQRTRRKLSLSDLAAALGHKSHSHVAEVLSGKRRLSLEAVEDWANALVFEGEERIQLYRSAAHDLGPAWFEVIVKRAEDRTRELERKVAEFEAAIVQDWRARRVAEEPDRAFPVAGPSAPGDRRGA